ncbi:hypothetical protein ISS37_09920 [candidate division KSB1 bacterium]|nr:hypothetical protein [candidate division KSB1 bacterium]
MGNVQLEAFGELFQSQNSINRLRNNDFVCPFDNRIDICNKPNRGSLKYGNCSAQVGKSKRIICPRRFYESNYQILKETKNFLWPDDINIDCYDELGINIRTSNGDSFHYGNIDWVLVNRQNSSDFCGIEIQTDSTTGTGAFRKGIKDLLNGNLTDNYKFGLNTLASFKGFLPQFIFKGQLFDDWKRPYCAVIQDELWEKFIKKFRIRYKEITTYSTETFLFFVYSLEYNPTENKYHIGSHKIYATRWIDLLFSFSVEKKFLLDLDDIKRRIQKKMKRRQPIITF